MSTSRGRRFVQRTTWPTEQLDVDRIEAIDHFRRQRLQEPLEAYLDNFEDARDILDDLIERTVDLTLLDEHALPILLNPNLLDGFRYLAGPPISLDDLKVLVDAGSLAPKALQSDPDLVRRLVATIRDGLDRRRFPWVYEDREPTETEREAAIIATATLIATRRTETGRRSEGKKVQEDRVRQALEGGGFVEVSIPSGLIGTLSDAPRPGSFSREVILGERKADLVVGLWDGRIMPIECKVSNSSINSVKRLNNDAAVKAVAWLQDFGDRHVVPVATLSGVFIFKLHNLEQAQARGLTIYWAHRLSDLIDWIERTRSRS